MRFENILLAYHSTKCAKTLLKSLNIFVNDCKTLKNLGRKDTEKKFE